MKIRNQKIIQILTSGMRWQPHRLICEEISHCYNWTPVSNDFSAKRDIKSEQSPWKRDIKSEQSPWKGGNFFTNRQAWLSFIKGEPGA